MVFAAFAFALQLSIFSADLKPGVIAKVNGAAITKADLDFAALQQSLSPDDRAQAEPKLIEQLIDRQLIRGFLASQKIEPVADELQFQIARAEEAIRKQGEDPQKVFAKIGYTPERLKSELGLPLAWQVYVRQAIKPDQYKQYYEQHKQELDGTQLRGRHIFLALPKGAAESEVAAKKQQLADLKRDVLAGKMSFEDAAKQVSEALSSKENGGDVGLFGWRGKLPPTVSQAAFSLKVDGISDPILSPLGVHLIQVTERHPGEFSLEDVRPVVMDRLSQRMWADTIEKERLKAKIERNDTKSVDTGKR